MDEQPSTSRAGTSPKIQMDPVILIPERKSWTSVRTPAKATEFTPLFDFNESAFQSDWANPKESAVIRGSADTCVHVLLEKYIKTAQFENGNFLISDGGNVIRIPWERCMGYCSLGGLDGAGINHRRDVLKISHSLNGKAWGKVYASTFTQPGFMDTAHLHYPSYSRPNYLVDPNEPQLTTEAVKWYGPPTLMSILKGAGIVLGTLGALKGVHMLYRYFQEAEPQLIASGSDYVQRFSSKNIRHVRKPGVVVQGAAIEGILPRIRDNYFVIKVSDRGGNTLRQLCGLGIYQRIGIMPKHYLQYLRTEYDPEKHTLQVGRAIVPEHAVGYTFSELDFLASEQADLCVFYAPTSTNMYKDIRKYFGTIDDLTRPMSSDGIVLQCPTRNAREVIARQITIRGYRKMQHVKQLDGSLETTYDNLLYNFSLPGACGSAVMCENHTRPIRGLHIAGSGDISTGNGYAAIVTREDLMAIPPAHNTVYVQGVEEKFDNVDDIRTTLPADSKVNYCGTLPPNEIPFTPTKTSLRPSLIADRVDWKTTKAPAILSNRDPRYTHEVSPLIAGCAKHGYLTTDFKTDDLEEVCEIRGAELLECPPLIAKPCRLSPSDAICGLQQPYYESLNIATSAGWPYCTHNGRTTKKDWLIVERNAQEEMIHADLDPLVEERLAENEALRRSGIVPQTIFVDTLKDEKKPLSKINKLGSTRVFCASPLDFTIAMRQNMLHFTAAYTRYRTQLKHSVGISMHGREVTALVSDLLQVGPHIITLDYSNFGPGFNASVAGCIKHTINNWLTSYVQDVDPVELEVLVEENINSHHAIHSTVYQQKGGSPSGSPLTVVINSEVNIMYIMLAWINIVPVPPDSSRWREFDENVCLRVYGDDLIMSVSDKYIDVFNGVSITNFFKKHGIVATDALKTGDIKPHTNIFDASYLKHTFDAHPTRRGEWIAKLDKESVLDTALWIQNSINMKEATSLNAEAAVRNAYGHGPDFFNEIRDKINTALISIKAPIIKLTWKEMDNQIYSII
uniref:Non-structural polyprotein n=1 Tax=PNG bee virus 10 TaxID=2746865 RepID=A0A7D5BEW9_9VIRU|nr:non-structural polyprotein [PNG bee virus 10]